MTTAQVKSFDLDNLDNEEVVRATHKVPVIFDADGEAVAGFVIVGKNSPEYQAASGEVRVENIQRASKRKAQIDASTKEGAEMVSRTVASNEKTTALAVVVDWYGFTRAGVVIPFDKALVEGMFKKFPTWQAAVINALDVDANFMKV